MPSSHQADRATYALILGVAAFVFLVDSITPLGYAEWMFYVIPVALCVRQPNSQLPLIVAVALMPLLIFGYMFSPEGADETIAMVNRALAFFALFGVAYLVHRIVKEKSVADHLMWLERGRAEVARNMLGEPTVTEVSEKILHALARYIGAQIAVLYRLEGGRLLHTAAFAIDAKQIRPELALGSTLAGEVAKDGKPLVLRDLPHDYLRIGSATGSMLPGQLLIAPVTAEGKVCGVMEFGFLNKTRFNDEIELLTMVADKIGSAIRSAEYRQHLRDLLEETQRQSEELQAQQEELRVSNEELEEQGRALLESQARLENQQAELEQTNVQLEEQAERLEGQKRELLNTQRALELNAEELGKANRYKSEFLANMSHELRTPLNSSLILSKILMENKTGSLSGEQVRYAQTIHESNNALLVLINDILDLSKIESGHADLNPEPVSVSSVVQTLKQIFDPVAREKQLSFTIGISEDAPAVIVTDNQRLQQVLRNLLANAFKFTEQGEVVLHIAPAANARLGFAVRDTGIGIPEQQQDIIFEAFRQADGTTSRKYGGTGLGLSISRELARRLGGEIRVQSAPGLGSTFTLEVSVDLTVDENDGIASEPAVAGLSPLSIPSHFSAAPQRKQQAVREGTPPPQASQPAGGSGKPERRHERLILVVEDDPHFASILHDLAQEAQFDCVVAGTGSEAIRLAPELCPSGILLDVGLPDQSGLSVLERLKRDPATRHIPIHMVSIEDHAQTALEMGAVGYAFKPVAREDVVAAFARLEAKLDKRARKLLVVEDDAALRSNIALLLQADDIDITTVGTAAEALELVSNQTFDCMVMDLNLPDTSGYDLLEKISGSGKYSFPPVIVYTGRMLSRDEEQKLRRYSRSIIIKGAKSPERLLDEVTLFLHRVESLIPPDQQKMLQQARQRDMVFEGRRILLAEDDVRNIFALTSVFEPLGAKLEIARNGREALQLLDKGVEIDLVLMDLMMPEMDGLTAMREIRKRPEMARLPIIALTAKAMMDDRKSCLDAGASDYIAKPIDVDKLISLCRVWMPK
ncbi:MAG TPA: response regulator [Noviherbaspirillum sp.]|uniref:response regulator n=1 Tax=Noviherbaspirillum sp. TaxID=1926288 RepID=UPI002DDD2457|nr:response regulator [Noviherbaspirillum sp.]HEV2610712.1 response regulator [Noviherbaspirillum sp.]